MLKKILIAVPIIVLLLLGIIYYSQAHRLEVLNAYSAKNICSCVFIADRDVRQITDENLHVFPSSYVSTEIDREAKMVSCDLFGFKKRTARYREGLGCALLVGEDDYNCSFKTKPAAPGLDPEVPWPYGRKSVRAKLNSIHAVSLFRAFDYAFEEKHHTRALLVAQNDTILKEQYAVGFSKDTPQLGWSMTKNIAGTLVGILEKQGKLDRNSPAPVEQWKADQRKSITTNHLLSMSSGLEWEEDYTTYSDVTRCIFLEENAGDFAASKRAESAPNAIREYSSGSTNIVSNIIRSQFKTQEEYWRFPYEQLFYKIGMNSAQLETDESGNFVLSSYLYATPRDWARYGTLYLHNGEWKGEQIISPEYVKYCTNELGLEHESFFGYGINFLLNTDKKLFPDAPEDTYFTGGHDGQRVFVIPSRKLVIVRLGVSDQVDWNELLKRILKGTKKRV